TTSPMKLAQVQKNPYMPPKQTAKPPLTEPQAQQPIELDEKAKAALEIFKLNLMDAPTAIKEIGEAQTFRLVSQLNPKFFENRSSLTTDQQRKAIEQTRLSREDQWYLLNKNDTYLEGLADVSKVYKNSADYGLTKGQADEYASALFQLAVDRAKLADTGGLSDLSRHVANQMLDERDPAI
ncbi:MAG: hypothetical protein IJF21_03270, partial [Clostridia bacterium]|nr:hypothetical protein [Clostridia bacterium]